MDCCKSRLSESESWDTSCWVGSIFFLFFGSFFGLYWEVRELGLEISSTEFKRKLLGGVFRAGARATFSSRCGRILVVGFMNDLFAMFFKGGLEGKVQLVWFLLQP